MVFEFNSGRRFRKVGSKNSFKDNNSNKKNNVLICEVKADATIYLYKKVLLAEKEIISELNLPIIGVKDIIDIHKALKLEINILTALINQAGNIDEIKEIVGEGKEVKIFSRIETSEVG